MAAPLKGTARLLYCSASLPLYGLGTLLLARIPSRYVERFGLESGRVALLLALALCLALCLGVFLAHISDQSATRFGRRRPFIWIAALPLVGSVLAHADPLFHGHEAWYFTTATFSFGLLSALLLPYHALGLELSGGYRERAATAGGSALFAALGVGLAWMTATGRLGSLSLTQLTVGSAALSGVLTSVSCAVVPTGEAPADEGMAEPTRAGLLRNLGALLVNRDYGLLCLSFALIAGGLSLGVLAAPEFLFHVVSAGRIDTCLLWLLIGTLAGILIGMVLSWRRERIGILRGAVALLAASQAAVWLLVPGDPLLVYFLGTLVGLAVGAGLSAGAALLADAADVTTLQSGRRLESLHLSLLLLLAATSAGILWSAGGSFLQGLEVVAGSPERELTAASITSLRRLQTSGPTALTGAGFLSLLFLRLSRRRYAEVRNRLGD